MKLPFTYEKNDNLSGESSFDGSVDSDNLNGYEDQTIRGLSDLYLPEDSLETQVHDIIDVLFEMGVLSTEQHTQLRQKQLSSTGIDAEKVVVEAGVCDVSDITIAKAKVYGLEFRQICPEDVDRKVIEDFGFDLEFIKDKCICPIAVEDCELVVGTSDPANIFAIEDVKRQSRQEVKVVVCSITDIEKIYESLKEEMIDYDVDNIISDMTDVEVVEDQQKDFEDLEKMAGQSPVIKFVNYLISNAIAEGASDIHIEPKDKHTQIRYRIDGVLFETTQSPAKMHPAIVSRIKIMSNLDISERRLPQDGKVSVLVGGRAIDLRISILPTNRGEKVVIRILDSKSLLRGLEQLGMEPELKKIFCEQIKMPNGIFLVTGPTGSGKSTTLYTALCQMDGKKMNISTV